MRTSEVTREFFEKANELAELAKVSEVKWRLRRLAKRYREELEALEHAPAESIAPKQAPG